MKKCNIGKSFMLFLTQNEFAVSDRCEILVHFVFSGIIHLCNTSLPPDTGADIREFRLGPQCHMQL